MILANTGMLIIPGCEMFRRDYSGIELHVGQENKLALLALSFEGYDSL